MAGVREVMGGRGRVGLFVKRRCGGWVAWRGMDGWMVEKCRCVDVDPCVGVFPRLV